MARIEIDSEIASAPQPGQDLTAAGNPLPGNRPQYAETPQTRTDATVIPPLAVEHTPSAQPSQ
jgi:hypothetical protein